MNQEVNPKAMRCILKCERFAIFKEENEGGRENMLTTDKERILYNMQYLSFTNNNEIQTVLLLSASCSVVSVPVANCCCCRIELPVCCISHTVRDVWCPEMSNGRS